MSRSSTHRRRVGPLLAAVLLVVTFASSSVSQSTGGPWRAPVIRTGPTASVTPVVQNPAVNIPAVPAYSNSCQSNPMGSTCETSSIAALNHARAVMGLPAYVLPANFTALDALSQLLVLSNADRAVYGLSQIVGFNGTLNVAAQAGVTQRHRPRRPDHRRRRPLPSLGIELGRRLVQPPLHLLRMDVRRRARWHQYRLQRHRHQRLLGTPRETPSTTSVAAPS